jgi:hypothetical protein
MTTGPAPSARISIPQQFDTANNTPSTVFFSNQMQSIPYSQYQSNPAYAEANSLWIKGTQDWSQYATVPMGALVSLLAISPAGGSGTLNFADADGQTYSYNYFFYPNSLLTFYADRPGRHTLSFVLNGKASNQVVIDVTGNYTPPTNYMPSPNYYPGSYPGYYYPGYYYPWQYGYNAPSTSAAATTAGETGGQATGGETRDHLTGGETRDHLTGGEARDHLTGGETGDHLTGGETGVKK